MGNQGAAGGCTAMPAAVRPTAMQHELNAANLKLVHGSKRIMIAPNQRAAASLSASSHFLRLYLLHQGVQETEHLH